MEKREMADKKEFLARFMPLARRYGVYEVWSDFIFVNRYALQFVMRPDMDGTPYTKMCKIKSKYQPDELVQMAELVNCIGRYAERIPYEDFLGELFMELGLADKRRKDYYTPPDVTQLVGALPLAGVKELEKKGWVSVADFCCGSGSLLLGFAHECWQNGIDPTRQVLFVAQDISYTAVSMCYFQMSIHCLPGFVVQGNALTQPLTGSPLFPKSTDGTEILETHTLYESDWRWRRAFSAVNGPDIIIRRPEK